MKLSKSQHPKKPVPPVRNRRAPRNSFHKSRVWSRMCSRSEARGLSILRSCLAELDNHVANIIEHWLCKAGVNADPKDTTHHLIGAGQIADHAIIFVVIGGLARQVSTKEQARADFMIFKPADNLIARETCFRANVYREAKPAWD